MTLSQVQTGAPAINLAARLILLVVLVAIAWFLGSRLAHLVRILLLASLLAFALEPWVRKIEGRSGMGRLAATSIVFSGTIALLAIVVGLVVPVIIQQAQSFQAGPAIERFFEMLNNVDVMLTERLARYEVGEVDISGTAREWVFGSVFSLVPNAIQLAADIFLVPFILFFLLRDGPSIKKELFDLVPNRYFEFTGCVLHRISAQIGNYLRGQAVAAIVVGVLSALALLIIGVDYAVTVGTIAGIANVIPYLGPIIGLTLALGVSFTGAHSMASLIAIVIAFLMIQGIDNTLVQPLVVGRSVSVHPLLVVLAVIVGGTLFGFWGLLLGVPAVAATRVIVQEATSNARRFDFRS